MIVIMIIGLIAVIGVPRFIRQRRREVETFIARLNGAVSQAALEAQRRSEPLRVFFSISGKKVQVQTVAGKSTGVSLVLPDTVEISDVSINGKSQFAAGSGEKDFVYFLINQEGISQEVKLVVKDLSVAGPTQNAQYEFYLNPFTSVFRLR